ncbi:flagellar hook capping FlgD N-terminal domain-containing protein [Salipiger abyssi]|uniref:flagellar hook capping FlgD N-terminal domain-containing protein n=1 Tax=Salipiger abyssi TaxID=1250539 RepID=UPI001A909B4A|nr:flagellar hook capping FlgD N-terminal domain-containing protein [Salipiger abyssi]MBN9886135.1 flagellin biosynthesis protein FlgD [Salipiger abyssi]
MQTSTTTAAQSSSGTAGSSSASDPAQAQNNGLLSSDFETFLRMLTTQMQNQDPLNPVDATDYATQLATFSSVEQQVLTNDLLKELTGQLTGNGFQQLASWIGMKALADAPVFFDGTPVTLRPSFAAGADSAILVVTDAEGHAVQRLALDPSVPVVAWAGVAADGGPLPSGRYSFAVESYREQVLIETTGSPAYNPIVEVRQEADTVLLTLSDGTEIDAAQVSALRPGHG